MRFLVSISLVASVIVAGSVACGSSSEAACDRVKTYCSVSASKDADCRTGAATARDKGCESSFSELLDCLVDQGAKCNAAGELEDDAPACSAAKNAYATCSK